MYVLISVLWWWSRMVSKHLFHEVMESQVTVRRIYPSLERKSNTTLVHSEKLHIACLQIREHQVPKSITDDWISTPRHLVQVSSQNTIVLYYTPHRVMHAVKKAAKLNILFTARRLVGSWKPVLLRHVLYHASGLGERDDRHHMWQWPASVFWPAQASRFVGD